MTLKDRPIKSESEIIHARNQLAFALAEYGKSLSGKRLAILTSHPIQYYAPLFRVLSKHINLHVFYSHLATPEQQSNAGFQTMFEWDVDLLSGYPSSFLENVSSKPNAGDFFGCDTPEIAGCLKAGSFSHVLSFGWHLKSLLQGIWAGKRLGQKVMVRGDSQLLTSRAFYKKAVKSLTYPFFLKTFDAALYVGRRNKEYYLAYGFPHKRLHHSPHAVDTERFAINATKETGRKLRRDLGIDPKEFIVLFAGKLVDFKRPFDVVDTVRKLRVSGLRCSMLVAGSGPLKDQLVRQALEKSVPLHMLGFQNQSQMPAVYAAADVLLLPSDNRETWGLVANEALASGLPVVLSHAVGCCPDLTVDRGAGRSYACGQTVEAASVIRSMVDHPPDPLTVSYISDQHSLDHAALGVLKAMKAC